MKLIHVVKQVSVLASPPTRRRGLKRGYDNCAANLSMVASHAEAWIETVGPRCQRRRPASPPTRRRGLKPEIVSQAISCKWSPPTRRRGLKPSISWQTGRGGRSPPTRRRGLKPTIMAAQADLSASPPTRRRGLKLLARVARDGGLPVASHAEAWIETASPITATTRQNSRLPRGGVD